MRYAIGYLSTALQNITKPEIEEILKSSKEKNNERNITGLLLFSEGNFFQVIEGEKQKIKELYKDILDDNRHYSVIKIFEKEIHREAFDGYECDFISQHTDYEKKDFHNYLQHINMLDKSTREAVKNILKSFVR